MDDGLQQAKESLARNRASLAAKRSEKAGYLSTAAAIGKIYDRMAADKKTIKGYRDNVRSFKDEPFDRFTGELYKQKYIAKMNDLVSNYDLVIKSIDTNMDMLNTKRAEYENRAYQCNGVIGYLESAINSLVHTIENWVN